MNNRKKFQLYLYDVWGNSKDGFEVNDIHPAIISKAGTIFDCHNVYIDLPDNYTNYMINRAFGIRGIEWTNEDFCEPYLIIGTRKNGKPFGELREIVININKNEG